MAAPVTVIIATRIVPGSFHRLMSGLIFVETFSVTWGDPSKLRPRNARLNFKKASVIL
jgi:hypothetical protein